MKKLENQSVSFLGHEEYVEKLSSNLYCKRDRSSIILQQSIYTKSFFTFKYDSIEEKYQAFFLPLGLPPIFLPLPLPRPLLGRVLVETSTTGGPS